MYLLTLEKFGSIDASMGDALDLKTPVEKAMLLLQEIQKEGVATMSTQSFSNLKKVIGILGSSSNIFKPAQIEEQVGSGLFVDLLPG